MVNSTWLEFTLEIAPATGCTQLKRNWDWGDDFLCVRMVLDVLLDFCWPREAPLETNVM
jgi:hypothetical protein